MPEPGPESLSLIASAPRGFGDLLARELAAFGATELRERSGGVAFRGSLECAYRACLWSRLANRVFLELAHFEAHDAEELHAAVRAVDWTAHLGPRATLACDFSGHHPAITHSHFGALRVKDGIVDALRARTGARPDIARERPHVRVHAHARGTAITLAIDLSGESLHRRGYRADSTPAPLKENVAAGVLLRAGWGELALQRAPFLDPLCGGGTLTIEAALIATDRAPGLGREYFGFLNWSGHDVALWAKLLEEASSRAAAGLAGYAADMRAAVEGANIRGRDHDAHAIRTAVVNAARAGIERCVSFEVGALRDAAPHESSLPAEPAGPAGLLCTNPPYGVRLDDREAARAVHRELGEVLRRRFSGWSAAVLTGAPHLGKELGLRAFRTHAVWNGGIECRLLRFKVETESVRAPGTLGRGVAHLNDTPGARMFANRLSKNLKRLRTWARRGAVSCYRVYDADMPEYAFAIDLYHVIDPDEDWLYVQEYAAPAEIERDAVQRRRGEVLAVLPEVTGVRPERIRLRVRRRTRCGDQYRRLSDPGRFHTVMEGELRFQVNFDAYLDTGIFLDHRLTRARLRAAAPDKDFLNLFAYTGTATVYAAAGGAASTTSVDLSRTYLDWAGRNLAANGFRSARHTLIQADCRRWLEDAVRERQRFGLIFLDPPTFSNSKRMDGVLDVLRDHPALIDGCAALLAPGGLILFSTNSQRFRLASEIGDRYRVQDVSAATLPRDFARNARIHRCFEIRLKD